MAAAKRSGAPDMSRNTDLAGNTVSKGGYNITYDKNGYATSAVNHSVSGSVAPSAEVVLSGGSRSSSGGSSYDRQYLSDSDLASLSAAQDAYQAAQKAGDKTGMLNAHREAEAIRSGYGYSGGGDGSDYIPLQQRQRQQQFSYISAPTYVNRYQSQIDDLTAQILGRAAFEYDPEQDPTYQQYKESYTRAGQRAMQDTLGQVSARTGGLASSYAGSAAQQAYDNYMAALADKVPELRQLAYSMYQDEGKQQQANLEMLMALEQGDYAKYADLLGQYNTDRSFAYNQYRDQITDDRYDNETSYNRDIYADETAYNRGVYADEADYDRKLAKAQTLAAAGDFSGYRDLGYSDKEIASMKASYDATQLLAQQSARRSGGSGGGGGNSGAQDYDGLFAAAQASGNPKSFISNNYKRYGFSSNTGLYDDFKAWNEDSNLIVANYAAEDGSWIAVPGLGRVTPRQLQEYVDSGIVKETISQNGKVNYTLAR